MTYNGSQKEKEYYEDKLRKRMEQLRDIVFSIVVIEFKDQLDPLIREMIKVTSFPPMLARDFLVDKITPEFREALKSVGELNINDNTTKETIKKRLRNIHSNPKLMWLLDQRLQEEEDPQDFLVRAFRHADISASMNFIEQIKEPYRSPFFASCQITKRGSAKNLAVRIRELRNDFVGHLSPDAWEKLTRDVFLEGIEDIRKLAEMIKHPEVTGEIGKLYAEIDTAVATVMREPLSFEQLKEDIPGFSVEKLEGMRESWYTDFDEGMIYLTDKETILQQFEKTDANNEISRQLEQIYARLDQVSEEVRDLRFEGHVRNTVKPAEVLPRLDHLAAYKSGHLTREMEQEIFTNAVVFADKSVWTSQPLLKYIPYTLIPALKKNGAKLFVDWATRTELYQMETNPADPAGKTAMQARNLMSLLHHNSSVAYGPVQKNFVNAQENLIYLAKRNPGKRFVILTQDREFTSRLAEEGLPNVLPLMIVADEFGVRRDAREMVYPFAVYRCEDEQEETFAEPEALVGLREEIDTIAETVKKTIVIDPQTIKAETGKVLTVKIHPGLHDRVYTDKNQPVILKEKIAEGGEGTIYRTDLPGTAAKIYHEKSLTENRRDKLTLMTELDPQIEELCWPEALLYTKDQEFTGYLMPVLEEGYEDLTHSVLQLSKEAVQKEKLPQWDRLALVKLCIKITDIFMRMHKKGILMGDVNPNNIMINIHSAQDPEVRIVDCDSMQAGGYPCPVGVKIFTNPKIYERLGTDNPHFGEFLRTEEDELYSVAALLFKILMLNGSPFEGKGMTSIDEAMRTYNFSYRSENTSGAQTPDGPGRMIWNNTLKKVKDDFVEVFTGKGFVSLQKWNEDLDSYMKNILNGNYTSELIPNKYWDTQTHEFNTDFICEWCGSETNMPKERYSDFQNKNMPMLCPRCNGMFGSLKYRPISEVMDQEIPRTHTCRICKKTYTVDNYHEAYLVNRGTKNHEEVCPECKEKTHTRTCSYCGKILSYNYKDYMKVMKKERVQCEDCLKPVEMECHKCHKIFTDRFSYYDRRRKAGKYFYCKECRKMG